MYMPEHRKFLKSRNGWLEAGDFLPDSAIGANQWRPFSYITDYLILVTMSTSCEPCVSALDMLHSYLKRSSPLNLLMAVDCEEQDIEIFQTEFKGLAAVHRCPKDEMKEGLKTTVYPWAYGINKVGQIVTSSVCGNRQELSMVIHPFQRYTGLAQ